MHGAPVSPADVALSPALWGCRLSVTSGDAVPKNRICANLPRIFGRTPAFGGGGRPTRTADEDCVPATASCDDSTSARASLAGQVRLQQFSEG